RCMLPGLFDPFVARGQFHPQINCRNAPSAFDSYWNSSLALRLLRCRLACCSRYSANPQPPRKPLLQSRPGFATFCKMLPLQKEDAAIGIYLMHFGKSGCMAERLKSKLFDEFVRGSGHLRSGRVQRPAQTAVSDADRGKRALTRRRAEAVDPRTPCGSSRRLGRSVDPVEVTLLGQNVNSYRDVSSAGVSAAGRTPASRPSTPNESAGSIPDLLDRLSAGYPACPFRFTSPHPKISQPACCSCIGERPNLARQLHLPAQSAPPPCCNGCGEATVGRPICDWLTTPGAGAKSGHHRISSADSAAETEADHEDTLELLRLVRYSFVYHYAYSVRERTRAHRLMKDDVPRGASVAMDTVYIICRCAAAPRSIGCSATSPAPTTSCLSGSASLVLIEGDSRRSADWWRGANDQGIRCCCPSCRSLRSEFTSSTFASVISLPRVDSAGAQRRCWPSAGAGARRPAGFASALKVTTSSNNMHALLEAKACLIHSALSRPVDGQQVEKARRQYIENTRNAKLRPIYKLDEEKLQSDFRVLKFIGCELFSQTLPDHVTKSELVDFVITVYGNGRECSVSQRLFQLIDGQNLGRMRRSAEVDRVFRDIASADNQLSVGQRQLVLIGGDSRRSLTGIRVLLPKLPQSAQRIHQFDIRVGDFVAPESTAPAQTLLAEPLAPVPDGPAGSNNMHALLEAKACLIHSALSRPVDGQQVSWPRKKLVLAEKARRQYIENTRNAKLRRSTSWTKRNCQSDFRVLKFIALRAVLADSAGSSRDFVITVYGNGRECSVSQRLFQLIDGQNSGRVNQLDLTIYCEPILTKPVLQELAGLG
uniref:EF-hand domain-containing protein n=1 Tax=Macrostomum lignano TaxID=282301 RepID=A0A1I8JNS6_9PLAT